MACQSGVSVVFYKPCRDQYYSKPSLSWPLEILKWRSCPYGFSRPRGRNKLNHLPTSKSGLHYMSCGAHHHHTNWCGDGELHLPVKVWRCQGRRPGAPGDSDAMGSGLPDFLCGRCRAGFWQAGVVFLLRDIGGSRWRLEQKQSCDDCFCG